MQTIIRACRGVFQFQKYRLIGVGSFLAFLTLYLITLPASYTGGRIGLISLQQMTLELAVFAVVMAALLALIVPMTVFLLTNKQAVGTSAAAGGVLASVLTPFLCCSPLVPAAVSTAAAAVPMISPSGGLAVQWFVATYETEIYLGVVLLLVLALYQNARRATCCSACVA